MLRVARTLTGNPTDAEDLIQETVIRAFRALDRFDGAHPRAWQLTILRHTNNRVAVLTGRGPSATPSTSWQGVPAGTDTVLA